MMSSVAWSTSFLVVLLHHAHPMVWHCPVESHPLLAAFVSGQPHGATILSHTTAACPHVLQALTALPTHISCRSMMALMSDALETCDRTTSGSGSSTRISLSNSRWSENTIHTHKFNTLSSRSYYNLGSCISYTKEV
jgi:hypothetical protein